MARKQAKRVIKSSTPDFYVSGGPSVFLLEPQTDEAREWVEENVQQQGFQPYWPKVVVEWRYMEALVAGLMNDGFTASR